MKIILLLNAYSPFEVAREWQWFHDSVFSVVALRNIVERANGMGIDHRPMPPAILEEDAHLNHVQ
jgi:hypothetical protein